LAASVLSGALVLWGEAGPTNRVSSVRTEMRPQATSDPESTMAGQLTWPYLAPGAAAAGPTVAVAADPAQASPTRPAWPTRTTPSTAVIPPTTSTAVGRTTTSSTSPPPPATGSAPPAAGYGCAAALAWLSGNAAPGFQFICPGYALGHQAMTCYRVASVCPNQPVIAIADPCPAAYMNEASNSWVLTGRRPGPIDPFGYCE
jgi:hypothetical protein